MRDQYSILCLVVNRLNVLDLSSCNVCYFFNLVVLFYTVFDESDLSFA